MKISTMFSAYQKAQLFCNMAVDRRGRFGISVDKDKNAMEYQRYSRLSARISARFNGQKVCPNCVAGHGDHYSYCRHFVGD